MTPRLKSLTETVVSPYLSLYKAIYDVDGRDEVYDFVSRVKGLTVDTIGTASPQAVKIYATTPSGKLLVTREFRMPINDYIIDVPAGLIDPGEDVVTAAIRELYEETGVVAKSENVTLLPPSFSSAGLTDELVTSVIVEVDEVETTADHQVGSEDIKSWFADQDEINALLESGDKISARTQAMMIGFLLRK